MSLVLLSAHLLSLLSHNERVNLLTFFSSVDQVIWTHSHIFSAVPFFIPMPFFSVFEVFVFRAALVPQRLGRCGQKRGNTSRGTWGPKRRTWWTKWLWRTFCHACFSRQCGCAFQSILTLSWLVQLSSRFYGRALALFGSEVHRQMEPHSQIHRMTTEIVVSSSCTWIRRMGLHNHDLCTIRPKYSKFEKRLP